MSIILAALAVSGGLFMGGPSHDLTCESTGFYTGGKLTNGDHINMDITQGGKKFQVNVQVDRNIEGGYDTLGLRLPGGATYPLSEDEVNAGIIVFDYGDFIEGDYTVEWVQYNSSYFNQDRDPNKFLNCNEESETPEIPEKPDDIVKVEIVETRGPLECTEGQTRQRVSFREVTTTTVYTWDEESWSWVPGASSAEVTKEWSDEHVTEVCLPDTGPGEVVIGFLATVILGGVGAYLIYRSRKN